MTGTPDPMDAPYFSVCIPQYGRTAHLLALIDSFAEQDFRSFELCISDDHSDPDESELICSKLERSGVRYRFQRNPESLRYDGNLRASIALSTGRFLLLFGNDDRLVDAGSLARLAQALEEHDRPEVAICNYRELGTGLLFERMSRTAVLGSGLDVAVRHHRDCAFVSGVILDGPRSRDLATDVVDGSEMYQMFLLCRLLASGGRLLGICSIEVEKDIQIPGQSVDSYQSAQFAPPRLTDVVELPMGRLLEVVARGVEGTVGEREELNALTGAARRLLTFTYPFWGVEYRRVRSWRFAVALIRGLSPSRICQRTPVRGLRLLSLYPFYFLFCVGSLLLPVEIFGIFRPLFYRLAKRSS